MAVTGLHVKPTCPGVFCLRTPLVAARQALERRPVFGQQLRVARDGIQADLPAVVRSALGAGPCIPGQVLQQRELDADQLARSTAIVDELLGLPQGVYARIGGRTLDHVARKPVASASERHALRLTLCKRAAPMQDGGRAIMARLSALPPTRPSDGPPRRLSAGPPRRLSAGARIGLRQLLIALSL